tara:strand:+ start:11098 stop:11925 length:828 start_codon:yes stop_codon:yes gene_type:complete
MEIATLLNTHCPKTTADTLESILTFVGTNAIVCVDAAAWSSFKEIKLPAYKLKAFYHNCPKSPYRNVALGLKTLYEKFPSSDWYIYTEHDCLFASSEFKTNLKHADRQDVWMLGNDGKQEEIKQKLPLIEAIIGEKINTCHYLLGSCLFFCNEFMEKLVELDFFNKLINVSNHFTEGYFPQYTGYDLSEHLYPTLATHLGGDIGTFAAWNEVTREWSGSYRKFPIRWKPQLDPEKENFKEASILHPLKDYDHPIRITQRQRRKKLWKNTTRWLLE